MWFTDVARRCTLTMFTVQKEVLKIWVIQSSEKLNSTLNKVLKALGGEKVDFTREKSKR